MGFIADEGSPRLAEKARYRLLRCSRPWEGRDVTGEVLGGQPDEQARAMVDVF